MKGQFSKAHSTSTWWRIVLTVVFAVYILGPWLVSGPNTDADIVAPAEQDLQDQRGDLKNTDVFVIGRQRLWFPKRYEAESDQYSSVVVQAYGPNLVSKAERDSTALNSIEIRFTFHMHDNHPSRHDIATLTNRLITSPEESRGWLPESGLYEINDGATHYYFSETYTAPSAEPFYISCETDGYNVSSRLQSCHAGYLIHGLIFLQYSFKWPLSQEIVGWKDLDLAVRKFALSVLWLDGEISSLESTMGYDAEGRILRTMGSHTLHFPTKLTPRSYAYPGDSDIRQFSMCATKDVDATGCPNRKQRIRVFLQVDDRKKMPNDGDEMLARTVRNHAYGPVMLPGSKMEEYAYTEKSSARVYRMLDLDPSGRYPIVKCHSWCRSYFIATPGLSVIYDFDRENIAAWPRIDAKVRKQISDLLSPPPLRMTVFRERRHSN